LVDQCVGFLKLRILIRMYLLKYVHSRNQFVVAQKKCVRRNIETLVVALQPSEYPKSV